jgi:hypothetical protein
MTPRIRVRERIDAAMDCETVISLNSGLANGSKAKFNMRPWLAG